MKKVRSRYLETIKNNGRFKKMVCYAVPTVAAIIHHATRKNVDSMKKSVYQLWLTLLLLGGAIFGIVDHLINGELFLIGENLGFDILLGTIITIVTIAVWTVLVFVDKKANKPQTKTT
jgi:nitric oxide reductase large subunit